MKIVFVCCPEITGLPPSEPNNPREYSIKSRLTPTSDVTTTRVVQKGDIHTCPATWTFEYKEQDGSNLLFVLFLGDTEIGRLALPLRWFEPNAVCKQTFPVKIVVAEEWQVMMQVQLHLCENGHPPFLAREAPMRVKPAWHKKPETEETGGKEPVKRVPLQIQETLTVYVDESPAEQSPSPPKPQVQREQPKPQPRPQQMAYPPQMPMQMMDPRMSMPMYFVDPKTGQTLQMCPQPAIVPVQMPDGTVQMMPVYQQPMLYPMPAVNPPAK